jgi:hypothetical protein
MVRVRDGGGVLGRERCRCAGMNMSSPARHFFVQDRAHGRVAGTERALAPSTDGSPSASTTSSSTPSTDVGPDCDRRDQLGFERRSRYRGGVKRQSSLTGGLAQLVVACASSVTTARASRLPKPPLGGQQCYCQSRRRPMQRQGAAVRGSAARGARSARPRPIGPMQIIGRKCDRMTRGHALRQPPSQTGTSINPNGTSRSNSAARPGREPTSRAARRGGKALPAAAF